jgi:cytochrome c oxidase cbb3-type subunit 3
MIPVRRMPNPYAGNAHAIGEGKKLYGQYNCSGCHANGGGAIGPPLMDDKWIYGSAAENIFATIVEGRPQGMPAFGGRIVEYQIWQIVAYVRSLSGLDTDTAAKPLTQQAQQEQAVDEAKQ